MAERPSRPSIIGASQKYLAAPVSRTARATSPGATAPRSPSAYRSGTVAATSSSSATSTSPSRKVSSTRLAASSPTGPGPTPDQSSSTGPSAANTRFIGQQSWWQSVRGSRSVAASTSCRRSHSTRSASRRGRGQAATATGCSHGTGAATGRLSV
ncbi:hypothetical protein AB0B83_15005 [Micromonospora sp. NPDC049060]|uniref:hypothetical protein n=1 Tax=Micromonospora sp. NPDC049060 TaxID=3154828 RepID=UPI0033DFDD38